MAGAAVLFPGQGAQVVGMGRDVYDKSPAGKAVFDLADQVLGFSLTEAIFGGPQENLTSTDISQPAILTTSIAVVEAAREAGWNAAADATAGLSLGEYSALVFAGALILEEAIVLVHKRGAYMREAGLQRPGGMLSVIGLDEKAVSAVVEEAGEQGLVRVANLNCPGQTVLSGEAPALEAAEKLADDRGAMKCVMLKVDGAFHSPLMQEAADRLREDLSAARIKRPETGFVANATAEFAADPEDIRRLLVEQMTSPVLWEKSMRLLISRGVEHFAEIGPGRVLTGLAKRINRKLAVKPFSDMVSVEELASSGLN